MHRLANRPLVLSLLLALLGAAAAYLALSSASSSEPRGGEAVSVVVATRPLAVGQRIGVADVALRQVPASAAPADAARAIADAEGRYATLPVLKDETLLRAKLSDRAPGSNLASLIPAGRVAVSVAVSDVVSTGGFIAPGDRVDVLGVITREAGDAAQVVLQDVVVLAVANIVIGSGEPSASRTTASRDNPRSLTATVTLAVTTAEAQRLVQVDEIGKLRLALRARPDQTAVPRSP